MLGLFNEQHFAQNTETFKNSHRFLDNGLKTDFFKVYRNLLELKKLDVKYAKSVKIKFLRLT